jgi:DNA-binding LytR/AlgR family response regulator
LNTKIKCLLLDDELPGLAYLKMLCEQLPELEVVKAFNSPQMLLNEWESLDFDLLISDIEMPGMNGLEVADIIKGKAIIFTTAYKNFAVDAFDRDAVDYVVKPIQPERLKQAVQKVISRLSKPKETSSHINLNTDKGKALINIDKIFCIVTSNIDSRDKVLFLNDGSKITAKNSSFEKLLEMLPATEFCRINKKAVIALKHVQYYSHDEITADIIYTDGKNYNFPLTEIYRNDFMKRVKR